MIQTNKSKRIFNKLINYVVQDDLDGVIALHLPKTAMREKNRSLLNIAVKNGSEKCARYYLDIVNFDDELRLMGSFLDESIRNCKYDKILKVYQLCEKLSSEDDNLIFFYKPEYLLSKLLDPNKCEVNPKRLEYFSEIIESKVLSLEQANNYIEDLTKEANTSSKVEKVNKMKLSLRSFNRENLLNSLGI